VTAKQPDSAQETTQDANRRHQGQSPAVRIVGRGDGVVVQIDAAQAAWAQVLEMLAAHLSQADGFFRGERIALELGDLVVNRQQLRQLLELLAEQEISLRLIRTSSAEVHQTAHEFGLTVVWQTVDELSASRNATGVHGDTNWEVLLGGKQDAGMQIIQDFQMPAAITDALVDAIHLDATQGEAKAEDATGANGDIETPIAPAVHSSVIVHPSEPDLVQRISAPPYLYRGTLRSGQVFRHAGPIIVVGDVNPGAQVVSASDVYVWGRLRGIIHAGAMGDESTMVGALDFEPIQLRIANHIAISPRAEGHDPGRWFWKRHATGRPEIARVVNGRIVVDQWDARWSLR
jgi:septum formation inhibitor MinC